MPKLDKKQRHKAKREAKRREAKRRESISPLKRLADAPSQVECWMSRDFAENGQIQAFVYKQAGGLSGIACFLIDRGVVGLKDAWARMNVGRTDFNEMLEDCKERAIPMSRVTIEKVRRMIAGGLRWAFENGMRLPKDWATPALLIGGVGAWESADVSEFVKEFAGHPQDLRQRLIAEPFDDYLQRTDIDFIFSDSAPYKDQENGRYVDADKSDLFSDDDDDKDDPNLLEEVPEEEMKEMATQFADLAKNLATETTAWLHARNETPSRQLAKAWVALMVTSILTKAAKPDAGDDELSNFGFEMAQDFSDRVEESHRADYEIAVQQVMNHMETVPDLVDKTAIKYGTEELPNGISERD